MSPRTTSEHARARTATPAARVNDVHSRLNATDVAAVAAPSSLGSLVRTLELAAARGLAVSIAGGRHAMGGQQFCSGGLLLDTRSLTRVLAFDGERGTIEVEAGIQWPALYGFLERAQRTGGRRWGVVQKQTGADRLSLGGALAANVHGRGLTLPPIVEQVEAFTLVTADGALRRCSRRENAALFRLAIGGYGLFGVVYSVTLRLGERRPLERVVETRDVDGLADAFAERVGDGFLYGDFQFAIDPASRDFLRRGVFSCYRPLAPGSPVPPPARRLALDDWRRLIALAHTDKTRAFDLYAAHYVSTSGQRYYSDAHQRAEYVAGYHAELDAALGAAHAGSELITELYVPRERLADLMAAAAEDFRAHGVDVVYGTVRLIERDRETFLAWARKPWACVVVNLHTEHTRERVEGTRATAQRLIDLAIERDGSFYLTYHRWARRDQLETCHPQLSAFLAAKLAHDPEERFQSDWYRHLRHALAL